MSDIYDDFSFTCPDIPPLSPVSDHSPSSPSTKTPIPHNTETITLDLSTHIHNSPPSEPPLRRSTRQHTAPQWTKDYICSLVSYIEYPLQYQCFLSQVSNLVEPTTYKEVVLDPE